MAWDQVKTDRHRHLFQQQTCQLSQWMSECLDIMYINIYYTYISHIVYIHTYPSMCLYMHVYHQLPRRMHALSAYLLARSPVTHRRSPPRINDSIRILNPKLSTAATGPGHLRFLTQLDDDGRLPPAARALRPNLPHLVWCRGFENGG